MRHVLFRAALVGAAMCIGTRGPLYGQQTLELANGDRLSGRLLKIENATWVFRYGGADTKIAASRVAAFTARDTIGVRLSDGTIAAVTIVPADSGSLLLRLADGSTRIASPQAIAAVGSATNLKALEPVRIGLFTPFRRFWRASGNLGFSDKSGNSRSRGISTGIEVARRSPKDRLRFSAGLVRESADNGNGDFEPTVSKSFATLRGDVFFSQRFFTFLEVRQERDVFQDIALRSTYNGGLGWQVLQTRVTDLSFAASGGVRYENYENNGSDVAAVATPSLNLRQKLGPATLEWDVALTSNIEELDDYQFRSHATLTATVYKGLGFRIGLLNEYNNTPRPGVKKHDMLLTTTLAYSIGG